MKRIGEDVAEKLDYQPGVFTVERHIRGKWVCVQCENWCRRRSRRTSSTRASPPPGCWRRCWWPSTWITCRCTGRKHIFGRAGLPIARSTLAQWVGECGVQLQPLVDALSAELLRQRGAARRRDAGGDAQAGQRQDAPGVPVDLLHDPLQPHQGGGVRLRRQPGRQHVREFLGLQGTQEPGWRGKLVTDDFSGYKACFEQGVTEGGCMAHARRKFHELWANHGSRSASRR
jgi:transposase